MTNHTLCEMNNSLDCKCKKELRKREEQRIKSMGGNLPIFEVTPNTGRVNFDFGSSSYGRPLMNMNVSDNLRSGTSNMNTEEMMNFIEED